MQRNGEEDKGLAGTGFSAIMARAAQKTNLDSNRFKVSMKFKTFGKMKSKTIEFDGNSVKDLETYFNESLYKHFVRNGPLLIEHLVLTTSDPSKPHYVNEDVFRRFLASFHTWHDKIAASLIESVTINIKFADSQAEISKRTLFAIQSQLKVRILKIEGKSKIISQSADVEDAKKVFNFLFSEVLPIVKFPRRVLVLKSDTESLLYHTEAEKGTGAARFAPAEEVTTSQSKGMVFYRYLHGGPDIKIPLASVYKLGEEDPDMEMIKKVLLSFSSTAEKESESPNGRDGQIAESKEQNNQCSIL